MSSTPRGGACGLFFREQSPVGAQRIEVEELESGKVWSKCSLGHAQVIADVKDVVLDVLLTQPIGRFLEIGGQLMDRPHILALSSFGQTCKLHILDHAASEFGHRDTLECLKQ